MPTPPNDDTKVLFKLLADRQWHLYSVIRDALAATVPPGRALRTYESDIQRRRKYRDDPSYDTSRTEAERIFLGAKAVAAGTISSWRDKGLESRYKGPDREIKVMDGFSSWGIPGFEPGKQDSASGGEGSTEVPPGDSEPAQPAPVRAEAVSASEAAVEQAVEEDLGQAGSDPPVSTEPVADPWADPWAEAVPVEQPAAVASEPVEVARVQDPADEEFGGLLAAQVQPVVVTAKPDEPVTVVGEPRLAAMATDDPDTWLTYVASPDGEGEPTVIELRNCRECGLAMSDPDTHAAWHLEVVKSEASEEMALLNESQLRDLLSGVVAAALDQFQDGIEAWMAEQFDLLNEAIAATRPTTARWVGGPRNRGQRE